MAVKSTTLMIVLWLIISAQSGPAAGALCPQCVLQCTTGFIAIPPVWYACMAACCGVSLFTCFSTSAEVITPQGKVLL